MQSKGEIRKIVKERLARLGLREIEYREKGIAERLFSLPVYREAKTLFIYLSTPREAPTRTIISRALAEGKRVLLPRIEGEEMALVPYREGEALRKGPFGISEPTGEGVSETPDLAVVPLVAFDRARRRLGRGKGYYDRFLSGFRGTSVALALSEQECAEVPVESFDRSPDCIVTEKEILE